MKEKDLPIDRSRHAIYTKKAKQCVQKLLHRYYDEKTASELWEKIQLQYAEFLKDEPALCGAKMTVSIYDPILIFAWYVTVPDKPPLEDVQQDVYDCFMSGFDVLGKVFDLNRRLDNRLANKAFERANDLREGIVRYSFTQCPNAEFAKRHHLEAVLPLMCNCDHLAMRKLHAALIREGTCGTSKCCDYCIVGDRNPLAANYENVKDEQGLIVSRKK